VVTVAVQAGCFHAALRVRHAEVNAAVSGGVVAHGFKFLCGGGQGGLDRGDLAEPSPGPWPQPLQPRDLLRLFRQLSLQLRVLGVQLRVLRPQPRIRRLQRGNQTGTPRSAQNLPGRSPGDVDATHDSAEHRRLGHSRYRGDTMTSRITVTPAGETVSWLPAQPAWTDADGVIWMPATAKRLTGAVAKQFVRRSATRVAIERTPPGSSQIEWLDPATQKEYWDRHIAGHVEDGTDQCAPDEHGLTYHVSSWRDPQGHRMILISEMC